MSTEELAIAQQVKKQTRRGLLDALNLARPARLTFETLCGVFITTPNTFIRRDLDYLVTAGYVRWVNSRANAPWEGRVFELTKTGIELADRLITDPALEP